MPYIAVPLILFVAKAVLYSWRRVPPLILLLISFRPSAANAIFENALLRSTYHATRVGAASALARRQRCTCGFQRRGPVGQLRMAGFGLLDIPFLEPIEALWDFYTARDEIQEQMLRNAAQALKKNSVRAAVLMASAAVAGEGLARCGVIGDRGEGLVEYARENRRKVKEAIGDEGFGIAARSVRTLFRRYRALSEKAKFTIALSFGSVASQAVVNAAVSTIKLSVGAFVILEMLAFAGFIGEPGESILEWIDDHDDELKSRWGHTTKKFRRSMRRHCHPTGIVRLYEAAVDEEKVATFGLGLGLLAGSFV